MSLGLLNARSHVATDTWRPKSVEDTVDAGVHPVVAAMRLASIDTREGKGHVIDGMDLLAQPWMRKATDSSQGYTYLRKNGHIHSVGTRYTEETAPVNQLRRVTELGMNPCDFFKQAKDSGLINPWETVLKLEKSGPREPTKQEKLSEKNKNSKNKKTKTKKKKRKKKKNKKDTKKSKKRKRSSSSSSSSSSDSSSSS